MKKALGILLLILFTIQSTSQLWITASFYLNRDFIARVLCINKDLPESNCKGACQLKKRINQDQEKQQKSGIDSKVKDHLVYLPCSLEQLNFLKFEWTEKTFINTYFTSFLTEGCVHAIFHPPASIV